MGTARSAILIAAGFLVLAIAPVVRGESRLTAHADLTAIGLDQNLGQQVPPDLVFKDETGKTVRLAQYFHSNKPILLTLVYFRCPMLCTMVLSDVVRSLKEIRLDPVKDFQLVTVSFDPRDTPPAASAKKSLYVSEYGRDGANAGWHFLTGQQSQITALTKAVGFHYHWDPVHKVFAHPSGIIVLTPSGKISRYFFGINYEPVDLKLALIQASGDRIGSVTDHVLLYCCSFNPKSGKYDFLFFRALNVLGVVLIVAVGSLVWASMMINKRRKRRLPASGSQAPG